VTCDDDQIPKCKAPQGTIDARCITPPQGLEGQALEEWFLREILGENRPRQLDPSDMTRIIEEGVARFDDQEVRFKLPRAYEKWFLKYYQQLMRMPEAVGDDREPANELGTERVCQVCLPAEPRPRCFTVAESQVKATANRLCGDDANCTAKVSISCRDR
jgi:hypothetical protein